MPEPRICLVPKHPLLVCIRFECLGQTEARPRHEADIAITTITELGERR